MKKELTKQQIEDRKMRRQKTFRILAIVSFVANIFFLILCFVACANSKKDIAVHSYDHQDISLRMSRQRNELNNTYNNDTHAYGINYTDILYKPNEITNSYYANYYVSLGGNSAVVVRNNESGSLNAVNEEIQVQFRINANNINGSLIWIRWGNLTINSFVADSQSNSWVRMNPDTQQPVDVWNTEIYLPVSLGYQAENYERFNNDLHDWFRELDYYDIDLSHWSPYAFLNNSFILNGVTAGVVTPIEECLFSINGQIYDSIYYSVQVGDSYIWYSDANQVQLQAGQGYIAFVVARNSLNNRAANLMSVETKAISVNNGTTLAVVDGSLKFINNNYSSVRLWKKYAVQTSSYNSSYTNYDIFTATFNGFTASVSNGTGQFGDVFGLFGDAFTGLAGVFTISILPGLTIGMLLFLPLVAMIVFAIIKVIKK